MKGLIFTYVLAYGGAVASLFQPFIGLCIYICFALICPENLWFWAVPKGNYSRDVAIGLLVGWAINGFGDLQFGRARPIAYSLIAILCVWIIDGSLIAPDKEVGLEGVVGFSKIVLPFIVGLSLINSVGKLKTVAWVIVLSQGYLAYEFNSVYYSVGLNDSEWRFRGLDNNGIAIVMDCSVGLALFLGLESQRIYQKLIALAAAAMMAHVVLFSMSRGGMLGLCVVGVVSFLLIPKKPTHYLVFFLIVLLTIRLAGPAVRAEFFSSFESEEKRDNSSATRVMHWKACFDSMLRRPMGVGPDMWPRFAPEYGLPAMEAHTTWLQLGAELGFQGLLAIGLFYGLTLVRLWKYTFKSPYVTDPWIRTFARMVIASLVGFIVSAQFVTVEGVELPYFVVMLGAATLKIADDSARAAAQSGVSQFHGTPLYPGAAAGRAESLRRP